MKVILESLERQLVLFPIAVVLLATGSFLLGGHCAAWQWYVAFVLSVALPFVGRCPRREAMIPCGTVRVNAVPTGRIRTAVERRPYRANPARSVIAPYRSCRDENAGETDVGW